MRIPIVAAAALLLLYGVACHHHQHPVSTSDYDCANPSGYGAVKKIPHADGHCEVIWDVADPHIADDPHPPIGLVAARNDELKFKHSGGHNFHYSIRPDPGGIEHPPNPAPAEQGCDVSPVAPDPQAGQGQSEHVPGVVHLQKNGAAECHYKITFVLDDGSGTVIDPHIKIGSGK